MKKIPPITKKDIASYLKTHNLDAETLFSYNRLTKQGSQKLYDCLYHFTGAKVNGKSISIDFDEDRSIQSGNFDQKPFDHTLIDSPQALLDSINEVISYKNFVIEQIGSSLDKEEFIFDSLSEEDQKKHQEVMQQAQSHIDKLNEIGKERALDIKDLPSEVVDDLLYVRDYTLELRDKLEKKEKELKEMEQDEPNNEMER